jgi:hypothetical protein
MAVGSGDLLDHWWKFENSTTMKITPENKAKLMEQKYRSTKLLHYDNIGTIRTGKEWFDRYMIYCWEVGDFEVVA